MGRQVGRVGREADSGRDTFSCVHRYRPWFVCEHGCGTQPPTGTLYSRATAAVTSVKYRQVSAVAKLISRSTIDMPWRNFLGPEFRKKSSRWKYLYFCRYLNFPKTQCGNGRARSLYAKNNPFIPFDRTPTCDRQTDTRPQLLSALA